MKQQVYTLETAKIIELLKPRLLSAGRNFMLGDKFELPNHSTEPARQLLGLILVSLVANCIEGSEWLPATDPLGYDGCLLHKSSGIGVLFEQVLASSFRDKKIHLQDVIRDMAKKKNDKGKPYAENVNLLIFCDMKGWVDVRSLRQEKIAGNFKAVWICGRVDETKLLYMVELVRHIAHPPSKYLVNLGDIGKKANVRRIVTSGYEH